MSLLLVVVLLFFSSSSSVSSHQYYVSDDCSSVTHTPCNPLSVYAGDMSQYNNTIFYFIGTSNISNYKVNITAVKNVTLHGLDQSPGIHCRINKVVSNISILVYYGNHVIISNISFSNCSVEIRSSSNITITDNSFFGIESSGLYLQNAFDVEISSSVYIDYEVGISYNPLPVCSDELLHYSLILANVNLKDSDVEVYINHDTSYNISIVIDQVTSADQVKLLLCECIFNFFIIKSSFHGKYKAGLYIEFVENLNAIYCTYPGIKFTPNLVLIEDSQFYHSWRGFQIISHKYLPGTMNYHIIIKSCLMYDNIDEGLFIDGTFLRLAQIDIIDTELIGNGGNKIMNSNAISLSNVTVANSHSTGLTLETSLVTIKNDLMFTNNTGVVGGGLAINDSSELILTSSANLEFIDNHASYKSGGIYVEESTNSDIKLMTPNIPLTLINNSAGLIGGDMYGYYRFKLSYLDYQLNLTNTHISSTSNPESLCFCDPHAINITKSCSSHVNDQHIYPGQSLKFYVTLLGYNYFKSLTPTDGTVQIYNYANFLQYQMCIPNTCSLIEYTPKLTQIGHRNYLALVAGTCSCRWYSTNM